jgi:threonine dehydratase
MKAALEQGRPIRLPPATTIADGIAVREAGATPFALVKKYVDEIVTVSEGEIANAVLLLLETEKTVAEGAAATPLAAVINRKIDLANGNVGLVISGGNIDMNLISRIIEKGLIQDGRLSRLAVVISDRPGPLHDSLNGSQSWEPIFCKSASRGFGQVAIGETEVELILENNRCRSHPKIAKGSTRRLSDQ